MKKLVLAGLVVLAACSTKQVTTTQYTPGNSLTVNGKIFTSLFQQRAAEYRALCFQAFNTGRSRIDSYRSQSGKPRAIVTDIDETILDNSQYELSRAVQGKSYDPQSWFDWTSKGIADTVPGAAAFLKYAALKGYNIFYITNRDEKEKAGTLKNLQRFGLPDADEAHLMLRKSVSSKEARRQSVFSTHDIVMYLGDNLADFSALFDKKSVDERLKNTNFSAADFGNRFIIIPNPVYGDWETSLYNYNNRLTSVQKDSVLQTYLPGK